MTKYPAAVGMKRAKSQGMYLWHSSDGGRLYETSDSGYWAGLKDMEQVRERLGEVRTALKKGGIKTSWTFADAEDFKIPYLGVDTVSIFVEEA